MKIMNVLLGWCISFIVGVIVNDLTESYTVLKLPVSKEKISILETHSSIQFDLEFTTLLMSIFIVIFITIAKYNKKREKFLKALLVKVINFEILFYLFIKGLNYKDILKKRELGYAIGIFIVIFIPALYFGKRKERKQKKDLKDGFFMEKRIKDIERLKKTLEVTDIVGIDSDWGEGKTYLIDKWLKKDEIKNNIIISMLSIEDDVLKAIFSQLDKILINNGKIGFHSNKIKKFFNNQSFFSLNFSGIFSNLTQKEAILEYKLLLESLDEKVYIVFDDLDRIEDLAKIEKILNFGVEFSSERIKIVYLYHKKILTKINSKFDRHYIEKFIPIDFKLTKLSFEEIFNYKFNIKRKEIEEVFNYDDFEFIRQILKFNSANYDKNVLNSSYEIENLFEYKKISIEFEIFNFRKIDIFIKESINIKRILQKNGISSRSILGVMFIKIFLPKIYEKLDQDELLEKIFIINNSRLELKELAEIIENKIFGNRDIREIKRKIRNQYDDDTEINTILEDYKKIPRESFYPYIILDFPVLLKQGEIDLNKRIKINKEIEKIISIGSNQLESNYEYIYRKINKIFKRNSPNYSEFLNELFDKNDIEYRKMVLGEQTELNAIYLLSEDRDEDIKKFIKMLLNNSNIENRFLVKVLDDRILKNYELRTIIFKWFLKAEVNEKYLSKDVVSDFLKKIYTFFISQIEKEIYIDKNIELKEYIMRVKELLCKSSILNLEIYKNENEIVLKVEEKCEEILLSKSLRNTKKEAIMKMTTGVISEYEEKLKELKRLTPTEIKNELEKLYKTPNYRKFFIEAFIDELTKEGVL